MTFQTLTIDTSSIEQSQDPLIDALARPRKRRQLIAQWMMVDGKLVCRWNTIQH